MNKLPIEKRVQIIQLLVEGNSMRSTERIVGCSINTITKLLRDVGMACAMYQTQALRNLNCKQIQCDEIWAFCGSKEKNVAPEHKGELGYGDVYTFTAIDRDSKLMVSYLVGRRTQECANAFTADLASRLANRVQVTTDGYRPYIDAIYKAFGGQVDYAQLVKSYSGNEESQNRRYSPSSFVGADVHLISGKPDKEQISTSHVERQNLTMRMGMRRFTRLTNAFSRKVENLEAAVSLHFMYYNFGRIHKTLRVTPAMEAGIADHVWSIEEIANLAG